MFHRVSVGILDGVLVALHTGSFSTQPLFLAVSIPSLSLLLPLMYHLKYKLMGTFVVTLPRHKKALSDGDTIRDSAYGVLVAIHCCCSLLQDTSGGRFLLV